MILLGLGGNLPSAQHGPPARTLTAALALLDARGVHTVRRSRWYRSAPVPDDGSPWYTNGVALVETRLKPAALLAVLLEVESRLGRLRTTPNAPRSIDLDLLAYGGLDTWPDPAAAPQVPHPRLHERAFVLLPLAEVAPGWRHPALGQTVKALIRALPPDQTATPLPADGAPAPDVAVRQPKR